jgi:hypothetical protein
MRLSAAALLPLPFAVLACRQACMQNGYARDAKVTSEYQLVTTSSVGARTEQRGFGPDRLRMHMYDAFECDPYRPPVSKNFWIDLGPECRLMARAESHVSDTGRSASGQFIQSEVSLFEGHGCALTLDDGRRIEGTVKSGVMVIRPNTVQVDLAMSVPGGTFHLVQTGAWN